MSQNIINYEALIDESMRGLVRNVLESVKNDRLPGEHHFYISFLTNYPEVFISQALKARYPEEITIVIQYQFENLKVDQNKFSVTLTFDGVKERIEVPYGALTSFADPSSKFGVKLNPINPNKNKFPETKKESNAANVKQIDFSGENTSNVIALDKFRKKK